MIKKIVKYLSLKTCSHDWKIISLGEKYSRKCEKCEIISFEKNY